MSNILLSRNVIIVRIGDKAHRCTIVYETGVICEVSGAQREERGRTDTGGSELLLEAEHDGQAGGDAGEREL